MKQSIKELIIFSIILGLIIYAGWKLAEILVSLGFRF